MTKLLTALTATLLLGIPASGLLAETIDNRASFRDILVALSDDPVPIDWRTLAALNLDTGEAPSSLQALDGKRVVIAAFIVPLEDDMQRADEFLL
ncbi:MAG TPA: hypothetical protein PLL69_07585, partial [Gemmatimonadales bacterium]|nr:hypothetical protein [Gemmatimonadales bacterium]